MNGKFFIAILVICMTVGGLMYSALNANAKSVLTVKEIAEDSKDRKNIRLGARVTEDQIRYQTSPKPLLEFYVRDIVGGSERLEVIYHDRKPDTLKAGRDVILEGNLKAGKFEAKSLVTQCPSKYEPIDPENQAGDYNHE